jgi:small-conductance mechanosensitive channel
MDSVNEIAFGWWEETLAFFNTSILKLGNTNLTLGGIVYVLFVSIILIILTEWVKKLLVRRVLNRYIDDRGLSQTMGTLFKYIVLVIGFAIIFQSIGFNLSTLGILAGALGVGIGFGLQNITNNFISGIIILFERPIKIGDRVEVGEITGDVVSISIRSTTIITNDNITIIVPNSQFIDGNVINWSHNDRNVRFRIPIGVSYNEDPEKVRQILLEVAQAHEGVLDSPPPMVIFNNYGDSSLDFELAVWTNTYISKPGLLKSEIYFELFKKFKQQGIEIPFPQHDLHLKSGFEKLQPIAKK